MREKKIVTEYGSVYYWLSDTWNDEKETIFFFPGLTADHTMFESQIDYFEENYIRTKTREGKSCNGI